MDKATMKQAIVNRLLNEQQAGTINPSQADIAEMALEALDAILALNYGTVTFEASEEAVDKVLEAAVTDDGRSNFMWLVTPGDGDVMLGVFPRGETFFEVEGLREEDYKRATASAATDRFGRQWRLLPDELCSTCGQPDNCGDCNHERLSDAEATQLGATNV